MPNVYKISEKRATRAAQVSISRKNAKLGNIPSFSTLPTGGIIRLASGELATATRGTCAGCCSSCESACYAVRSVKQYTQTARAWAENTRVIREKPGALYEAVRDYCAKHAPRYFRVHVSGEFDQGVAGTVELATWCKLAREFPKTTFYAYTKRADLIEEWRDQIPANFKILLSMWGGTVRAVDGFAQFHYDDGKQGKAVDTMRHCPAVAKDGTRREGLTCEKCSLCMRLKPGEAIAVYAH